MQLVADQPQRASIIDSRLSDLVERLGDDGYRAYLESLRWPHGPECPRCGSTRITWLETRAKYTCYGCRYQFRVTAGTLFHDSHVSLEKWLLAVALMLVSERGIPATQLQQILGGSYKTAWFLEHRIRAAMIEGVEGLGPLVALAGESEQAGAAPDGTLAVTPRRVDSPPGWQSFTRLITGRYQRLSTKYLSPNWGEIRWRAANNSNPDVFRDTVVALLGHAPLPFDELTSGHPPSRWRKQPA